MIMNKISGHPSFANTNHLLKEYMWLRVYQPEDHWQQSANTEVIVRFIQFKKAHLSALSTKWKLLENVDADRFIVGARREKIYVIIRVGINTIIDNIKNNDRYMYLPGCRLKYLR